MKKIWNISLFFVFLISVLMIVGQGFVISPLNDFVEIALRTMAAFSIQLLACRIGKHVLIKSIPLIATTGFALRGMWWFFNSRYWDHASTPVSMLYHVLPAVICWIVWSFSIFKRKS